MFQDKRGYKTEVESYWKKVSMCTLKRYNTFKMKSCLFGRKAGCSRLFSWRGTCPAFILSVRTGLYMSLGQLRLATSYSCTCKYLQWIIICSKRMLDRKIELYWSRIHERSISLRFLGIILSSQTWGFRIQTGFNPLLLRQAGGGGGVKSRL
jgi:hypothetical protein